ncbi:MAG: hypothetical protein ABFS16_03740 [Bacteroidota bacterium]
MNKNKFDGLACYTVMKKLAKAPISKSLGHLVLESDPTPEYYSKNNFPVNKQVNDWNYYIPVKNQIICFQDIVLRNAHDIQKKIKSAAKIYPGQISFHHLNYSSIWVKSDSEDIIEPLIKEFEKLGFRFFNNRKVETFDSLIYFKKYTVFKKIGEGIYEDDNNADRFFFEIPDLINFEKFISGINRIKNSCNYHLFDSFLTSIFKKGTTQDFIGIYSKHCDKNRFDELKEEIQKTFIK